MNKIENILSSKDNRIFLHRASNAASAAIAAQALNMGRSVVLVATSKEMLHNLNALTRLFIPEASMAGFSIAMPLWERKVISLSGRDEIKSKNSWEGLISCLYGLSLGKTFCIVCDIQSLLYKYMPLGYFACHTLEIITQMDLSPELIMEQAIEWGYERTGMVTRPGEISRRGDIFDIFPCGYSRPTRIEFFGDCIEEMRLFDPESQRSITSMETLTILPISPIPFSGRYFDEAGALLKKLKKEKKLNENEAYSLNKALEERKPGILPGLIWNSPTLFEEWLPAETLWIIPGEADSVEELTLTRNNLKKELEDEGNYLQQPSNVALRKASKPSPWNCFQCIINEPLNEALVPGIDAKGENLPEHRISNFEELFPGQEARERPWQIFLTALKKWQYEKKQILLSFSSERGRKKFLKLIEKENIIPFLRYSPEQNGIFALVSPFSKGMDITWNDSIILGEDIIYPRAEKKHVQSRKAFKGLDRFDDLKNGDLLVHRDYGIGKFAGLHHLEINNVANDYLLLEYSGKDKLYVPADRIALVQRFKGTEGITPSLDRLGSVAWTQGKEKARKAIEKIAADLVEMYAYRKVTKGFHYDPPGELFREFEATFNYEETPDQDKAIQDVLDDMDKKEPMDRLVCGDVGFGKTEVALRAAFRAASEGRQVVLLCPTTVLAEQHYQTFRSRLAGFPVNVGLLSRFVPKAKQKQVLKECETGQIDILVGTHRLLSNDVKLPNLALLILDEEQRFGVRHKEKLKEIKKNVDVLTLTATPIPRTLQLSMSGIRDLSIIETPPQDRQPVASAVLQRDDDMLRKIIFREIERKGQVFWVYNRIQGLENVYEYVHKLVPDARIGIAHGQMSESELETTMRKFWHGELDILVSTSIVESGLDFPQANTLIVDQAQMFGLGQLYQLRGRVGRSDRQAYAYFLVPDAKKLTDIAEERLRIILEMDFLGAGFQVAMEDLRLRGAGNILGEVQTGHMSRVGMELYLEMLEEAVARLKGQPQNNMVETELTLGIPAHIPDTYIENSQERLRFYKILTSAEDMTAREQTVLSIRDRFGPLPKELQNFVDILNFKQFLSALQAEKADISCSTIKIFWSKGQSSVNPQKLLSLAETNSSITLLPPNGIQFDFNDTMSFAENVDNIKNILFTVRES